ncbi:DUF952 domain-containing protein [Rhodopirellula sp. MGV]|uniref:DUF952 domain-containing protein n=1 Tax=Rhodopirellula sp. MGV TaxID=2023130 RepID=UPI000B96EA18|nr:DUF952 domain-containing protein [Rhodopirellula sp. MGV]OYP37983.1 hypothetical protein CGZ80_03950 [Rhodopirellula sp. MGV]PNY34284.1 DUF952 domain-containing protein [Rhodopirellula baltica]
MSNPTAKHDKVIYKIVPTSEWETAEQGGAFSGCGIDIDDGFIHLSAAPQVAGTLNRYFAGQTGLLLVSVDTQALGKTLRWEPSRDGELFPHVYGEIPMAAVVAVHPLTVDEAGNHELPQEFVN